MKTAKTNLTSRPGSVKNKRQIAIDGLYSMFEARRPPEFHFDGESHSAWEMVYIFSGSVGVTADDKIYTLSPGDVIFHHPMQFHKIWSEGGRDAGMFICSFYIDGELAHKLKNGVFRLNSAQAEHTELLLRLMRERCHTDTDAYGMTDYLNKLSASDDVLLQTAMSMLETLMLALASSDGVAIPAKIGENEQLYTKIAGILEERVYSGVTIGELAGMCGVSSATVKNCFSSFAGCGIHKYLLKIKMRTAIELLRDGKTVGEVSDLLHFSSSNYFSYVFKRETGKRASDYRK